MEKTFQFVDSTKVDSVTRKVMRSHVMRGKNAGKTVHRRSRLDLGAGRMPYDNASPLRDLQSLHEAKRRDSEELRSIERNLGNVLCTFPFPVELSENSLKTIDRCKYGSLQMNH